MGTEIAALRDAPDDGYTWICECCEQVVDEAKVDPEGVVLCLTCVKALTR